MSATETFPVPLGESTTRTIVVFTLAAVIAALSPGCGAEQEGGVVGGAGDSSKLTQVGLSNPAAGESTAATPAAANTAQPAADAPPAAPRKIIYDARVELVVDNLSATAQAILKLITANHGFIAESDQASVTSTQRRAMWRVRVPVDQFDGFIASVSRLGEVQKQHVGSQDVTAEFIDIQARIHNKQEEEKRLLKHLNDSTGKLEDILSVEREIARVRGEIETVQGRLKYLADRTALSTVTIEASEIKDYQPPVVASFPTQLSRTFWNSVENLLAFGRGLLLVVVALAPWVPFIAVGLVVVMLLIRMGGRSSRKKQAPVTMPTRAPS
jgi:Domain of unknown function (DUF4349)